MVVYARTKGLDVAEKHNRGIYAVMTYQGLKIAQEFESNHYHYTAIFTRVWRAQVPRIILVHNVTNNNYLCRGLI